MPANVTERDLNDAVDRYLAGATMHAAAASIGIPWQRLLFVLRDRNVLRANRHNQGFRNRQPRRSPRPRVAPADPGALTFGIEIECHLPAGTIEVGAYHLGTPVPGLPAGWNAQHDGSIQAPSG